MGGKTPHNSERSAIKRCEEGDTSWHPGWVQERHTASGMKLSVLPNTSPVRERKMPGSCRGEILSVSRFVPHGRLDTRGFCTGEIKPQTHSDRAAKSSRQSGVRLLPAVSRRAPSPGAAGGKPPAFAGDGVFSIA